jgi:putative colanic acid biosynthesis acetyltransferase WcaF
VDTISKKQGRINLESFDAASGLDRGRSKWVEALWYLTKCVFFLSPLPWPSALKCRLLRRFGATVGAGVNIKPRVNIHFPWKLELGEWCWLGEEVFILNFEPVRIGAHACVSQRAFLCGGNHDYRDRAFKFRNAPITIGEGAWVGACVFVGPGVVVGDYAVLTAGSVATQTLAAHGVYGGNPCQYLKPRWPDSPIHGS